MKTELKNLKEKVRELKMDASNKTASCFRESSFETKRLNIQRGKVIAYENVELLIDEMLKENSGK